MQRTANAQWAHDIRNTLGTVALHVDTMKLLSGGQHADIVASTHALLASAAAMCDAVVDRDRHGHAEGRCTGFDVRGPVAPVLPDPCVLNVKAHAPPSLRVSGSNPSMTGLTLEAMERKARALQDRGAYGASPA